MKTAAAWIIAAASIASAASEPSRPRGVGPEFAKFYKDAESFTCISNPSIKIPFSQVNDDYCDCPDGSDEPGTSACSYLFPLSPSTRSDTTNKDQINVTQVLPGFYCKNKGHQPSYVPYTSVNDGFCDYDLCCDGSEEWAGVGGVKCQNKCDEIGKEWRKKNESRQRALNNANKKRKEYTNEAQRLRKEVEDRINTLHTQLKASEIHVTDMEKELAEVERREKGKVVKSQGAKQGKMGVLVGLAKQRTEELRDHLVRVRLERDTSKDRVKELEAILSTFKEEYNPNFNDEGVKRAVRAWEDYAARDKSGDDTSAHDRDLNEITKTDADNGLDWESYLQTEGEDVEVLYEIENYLPKPLRDWVDQKLRDLRIMLIENGILADLSAEGGESSAVNDAKNRLKSAQDAVNSQRKDLESHNEDLNKEYGPDGVFRALKGQCISVDSGEYTYELCFMEHTTQKSKKGGSNTRMGNFVRFDKITVDEEVSADGKGLGSGERIAMRHENGQHCWNGPNRSTTVILACAEQNEIWKVFEEEKCVYRMEVGSPAVCEALKKAEIVKDEL
ncbi:hypothetical protein D6D13_04710 [Aureobasidium pullulans]|uniref:Glucosidase 2 subunit beta n=1 Tax=Aureobasidium pullulans TaxID=5580 RepID=A0A4S9CX92_AURPU|nr:hypothetical protein D6D13_04710 [Aureobasidium pullulans]